MSSSYAPASLSLNGRPSSRLPPWSDASSVEASTLPWPLLVPLHRLFMTSDSARALLIIVGSWRRRALMNQLEI